MKEITTVILQNRQGKILLYLRDNKPNIPFPHYWDLFGGHVERGETPEIALIRELKEELDIDLKDFTFFRKYETLTGDAYPNVKYVYYGEIDIPLSNLHLQGEGERLQFFSKEEIKDLKIANILKDILFDFIQSNGIF